MIDYIYNDVLKTETRQSYLLLYLKMMMSNDTILAISIRNI